jgi:two-component system cell cycle response regulator
VGARILIIEDNPANLELMSYLLSAFGHHALTASDGRRGLEAAESESPDLIICDVEIPEINGLEVARRLKAHPTMSAIPLIAVTAFAMVGDRDRVMAAGFDGYIPKPITPEKFVKQVETFLPGGGAARLEVPTHGMIGGERKSTESRATLLVVDNLAVNIDLLCSILEPSGYRVFTASNVDEGLRLARQRKMDLIISDVHMPGKDGYEFIGAVKADPALRAVPFMFLSSTMAREGEEQEGIDLGADRFILRPIEPQALLDEIESILRR